MSARLPVVVAGLAVAFLAFGLFSQTVFNTAHNEQMYVAAGYLLAQGRRLYGDFAFVQMPYSPLIYAAVFSLTGSGLYLFKAKLVNFLFMVLAGGLLYGRAQQVTRDRLLALLLLVVFLADYYLLRATIEASNYTMPIAFSLLAYVWLLRGLERPEPDRPRISSLWSFAAGIALGAAIGAKLYYATLVLPFGLVALFYPRSVAPGRRIAAGVLPLAAGVLVGLGPALFYALRDMDRFYFNNVRYHVLNALWREQNGFVDMGWGAKLETARELLTNPNYLILLVWLALVGLLWWRGTAAVPPQERRLGAGPTLAGLAALVALVTSFTPRPLFPQYFAMPVPFLLLWVAELAAGLPTGDRRLVRAFGVVLAVVGILAVLPRHTGSIRRFAAGEDRWSGVESVAVSHDVMQLLRDRGRFDAPDRPRVATLSPIVALETHLPFYAELATGSFVYRIGDLLTAEERNRYVATSPATLQALLDAQPPAAIFVGEEGELEQPLLDYAQSRGYQPAPQEFPDGQLYLK